MIQISHELSITGGLNRGHTCTCILSTMNLNTPLCNQMLNLKKIASVSESVSDHDL